MEYSHSCDCSSWIWTSWIVDSLFVWMGWGSLTTSLRWLSADISAISGLIATTLDSFCTLVLFLIAKSCIMVNIMMNNGPSKDKRKLQYRIIPPAILLVGESAFAFRSREAITSTQGVNSKKYKLLQNLLYEPRFIFDRWLYEQVEYHHHTH